METPDITTAAVPAPRKPRVDHPLTTIAAAVLRSRWITPRMVRLTLHSEQLDGFLRPDQPDQYVTVIFPRPGQELIELGATIDWGDFYRISEQDRLEARNYTVRSIDRAENSIDIDVLVHGGPGLGEHWAAHVKPGAPIYLWGPRVAYNPFPNVGYHLLFCDECAVPASAAIIQALPSDARGTLVAEVKNDRSIPPMPAHPGIAFEWLFSGDVEPGTGSNLSDAVARLAVPDELVYAWGGGEMQSMRRIGRHLRKHWGLKTASISATGYWRKDVALG